MSRAPRGDLARIAQLLRTPAEVEIAALRRLQAMADDAARAVPSMGVGRGPLFVIREAELRRADGTRIRLRVTAEVIEDGGGG